MQTVAVFTTKGGAGKSALTVFLAEFLSSLFDKRVLVVDLDAQYSSAIALLGEERLMGELARGLSLADLIQCRRKGGKLDKVHTMPYLIERPEVQSKGQRKIRRLRVLASDREGWHNLEDDLSKASRQNGATSFSYLREALDPLRGDFDIALLDFPGKDTGQIVRCGIRAADWWLLPVQPDRMGSRDLEGPMELIKTVWGSNGSLKPLGTALTMCGSKGSSEFKRAKASLKQLEKKGHIPNLFQAEISFCTEAKTALDDTLMDHHRTLDQRFGGQQKVLFKALKSLSQECLQRLQNPASRTPALSLIDHVNQLLTRLWSG